MKDTIGRSIAVQDCNKSGVGQQDNTEDQSFFDNGISEEVSKYLQSFMQDQCTYT